jgi:hypothetical protein
MTVQRPLTTLLLAVALVAACASAAEGANLVIVNKDPAGVGFNDPTAAAPVGGNSGTTLGQQRLNVFQAAAGIWGAKLNSAITIKIAANFGALTPCNTTNGILGSAGPTDFLQNFPGAPRANTYYPIALASALAGVDYPTTFSLPDGASIQAQFNSNIGTPNCLPSLNWYLGLDDNFNHASQVDLETVLLHEFGHGLGFTGLVNLNDGSMPNNTPDIFAHYTFDNSTLLHWDVMSNAQRLTSSTNAGNVVFDGPNVAGASGILTSGRDASLHPRLYTPSSLVNGSSVWHFDTACSPNLLMEPNINVDLTHNVDLPNDLTMKQMLDIGWRGSVQPPACSSFQISPTSANPTFSAGSQSVTITGSPAGCVGNWSASGNGSWLTVLPASGSGSGSTTVSWAQNNSTTGRSSNATIAGTAFAVNQGGTQPAIRARNDFNGDGKSDIIWRNTSTGDTHMWFLSTNAIAGGGFLVNLPAPPWIVAGVGDFNGDGKSDIIWRNTATGDTHIWLMNGNTVIGGGFLVNLPSPTWVIAGVGDFNGDGKSDIIWRNTVTGDTHVWLLNGNNIIGGGFLVNLPSPTWTIVSVGDFNGDGKSDIIWRNTSTGDTHVWLLNGNNIIGGGFLVNLPSPTWIIASTGDFNGDGKSDIIWRNTSTGDTHVWLLNGNNIIGGGFLVNLPAPTWVIASTGDFNGDGKSDIIWRNTVTGDTHVWLLNGNTVAGGGFLVNLPAPTWILASP